MQYKECQQDQHWKTSQIQSHGNTDGQSVISAWCWAPGGATYWILLSRSLGAPFPNKSPGLSPDRIHLPFGRARTFPFNTLIYFLTFKCSTFTGYTTQMATVIPGLVIQTAGIAQLIQRLCYGMEDPGFK